MGTFVAYSKTASTSPQAAGRQHNCWVLAVGRMSPIKNYLGDEIMRRRFKGKHGAANEASYYLY